MATTPETTGDLEFKRYLRDAALEEAARIAETRGEWSLGAEIRSNKYSPWTGPTDQELQRILGNSQVGAYDLEARKMVA